MIRVCCTVGTWQLVTLVASLQQAAQASGTDEKHEDFLIVYETGGVPDAFKETLQRMAEAVWPWKRIIWAYELLTNQSRYGQREFARLCQILRERLGLAARDVGEIWTCWLNRPPEKVVFETFLGAKIVLYEDGLTSYIPLRVADKLQPPAQMPFPQSLAGVAMEQMEAIYPALRLRRSRDKVDPRHLARVSTAYQVLPPNVLPPHVLVRVPRQTVSCDAAREVLARAATTIPHQVGQSLLPTASDKCRLLVLGQALSRNGVLSRDEERDIYQNVVTAALRKGYCLLWKEHPRISEPFFDDLLAAAHALGPEAGARLEQLTLPHAFPVELIADRLNLAGCLAGTSAAVFYLKQLYDIPCYTFADQLLPKMQGVDIFMNDLVRGEALPFSALPSVASGAANNQIAGEI